MSDIVIKIRQVLQVPEYIPIIELIKSGIVPRLLVLERLKYNEIDY